MANNQPKKRGISLSSILSFLLVAVTIFIAGYFLFFNGNGASTIDTKTFVKYLHNDLITEVSVTPIEGVIDRVEGLYKTKLPTTQDEKVPSKKVAI